jgi:hypothetical protein
MLTILVARNESVSETPSINRAAFEHEHRRAEHEYEYEFETMPEPCDATEFSVMSRLLNTYNWDRSTFLKSKNYFLLARTACCVQFTDNPTPLTITTCALSSKRV